MQWNSENARKHARPVVTWLSKMIDLLPLDELGEIVSGSTPKTTVSAYETGWFCLLYRARWLGHDVFCAAVNEEHAGQRETVWMPW
jgi:hypothetical protein